MRKSFVSTRLVTREAQRIGVISLQHGENNTLVTPLRRDLLRGLDFCEQNQCKAIVFASHSSKVFSTGLDEQRFRAGDWNTSPDLLEVVVRVAKSPLPSIAALDGVVAGGGLELALACNFRVGDAKTQLSLPETAKFGVLPGAQGTQRLARVVGVRRALEMMLSGLPIKGGEAKELGLLHQFVPKDAEEDVYETSLQLADALTSKSKIPDIATLAAPHALSNEEIAQVVDQFGAGLPRASVQAVCDALKAASKLPFPQGVEYEQFAYRQLLVANQRSKVIHFTEQVWA